MFKGNKHIQTKAILIEKQTYKTPDFQNEAFNLNCMRRGKYHVVDSKDTTQRVFKISFMSKKGIKDFYVTNKTYESIDLNSLGLLEYRKDKFMSFTKEKIATKKDVEKLNW